MQLKRSKLLCTNNLSLTVLVEMEAHKSNQKDRETAWGSLVKPFSRLSYCIAWQKTCKQQLKSEMLLQTKTKVDIQHVVNVLVNTHNTDYA